MRGQTNRWILDRGLPQRLRRTSTPAETMLWSHLRAKRLAGFRFRRQHAFGDYVLDLVCIEHRVVVEADGGQHLDSTRDATRDAFLHAAGFVVLRYWNHDILHRLDTVLESILSTLLSQPEKAHHPLPGPPLEGEGEVGHPAEKP